MRSQRKKGNDAKILNMRKEEEEERTTSTAYLLGGFPFKKMRSGIAK